MLGYLHKEHKVTKCLIMIQESPHFLPFLWETFILNTAVNKYYIGLGQEYKKYQIATWGQVAKLNYPLIQIDNRGIGALKCPTLKGGQWMAKVDLALCKGLLNKQTKGQVINVVVNSRATTDINIFWILLVIVEALKCRLKVYSPSYDLIETYFIPAQSNTILPLRRYKQIYIVSAGFLENFEGQGGKVGV